MEFYLDEKQKNKKRWVLKLKIYGIIAVFLFLSAGIFYFIFSSQFFKIKSVFVVSESGAPGADSEKLKEDLNFFFLTRSKISQFLGIDNILIWNGDLNGFLKTHPVLSVLEIKKDYWKKEIVVKFAKREKFGIWCLKARTNADYTQTDADNMQKDADNNFRVSSRCWWFDKDGIIFEKSPQAEGEMIYKVNDNSDRVLNLADKVLNKKLFDNLIKIFELIQKSGLNIKTVYIENLTLEEAEIRPIGNFLPKIYFSLRFNPDFALAAIESFKKTGFEKIQYIDFRSENRVYYK
ncbi:hypothetical protein HZB04_00950 [Candidatus Wolfebacteria bacterium]|nr:hypothetical protein [Candidatus Wolfebacteria bacterium]